MHARSAEDPGSGTSAAAPADPGRRERREPGSGTGRRVEPDTQQLLSALCPYLLSEDGSWRAARPMREHRCTAVQPPEPISAETQRRLCLGEGHVDCPAYLAAQRARSADLARAGLSPIALRSRHLHPAPSTVPVALDRPYAVTGPRFVAASSRRAGQIGLGALMVVAVLALVSARFSGNGLTGALGTSPGTATATSTGSAAATAAAAPTGSPVAPSPSATTRPATPRPSPTTVAARTYRVRSGDTLYDIARRFGTTVERLKTLNNIPDASVLQVGQVLKLP